MGGCTNTALTAFAALLRWLFVPRGCAVFHVPRRNQHLITTIPTSHGYIPITTGTSTDPSAHPAPNNPLPRSTKSPWVTMFEFVGTVDNAPYLCLPGALAFRETVCPGGEKGIREYSNRIAFVGAKIFAERLGTEVMSVASRECALVNVRLPIAVGNEPERYRAEEKEEEEAVEKEEGAANETRVKRNRKPKWSVKQEDAVTVTEYISRRMVEAYDTFIAVMLYRGNWYARVSGQVYLEESDFEAGVSVVERLLGELTEGKAGVQVKAWE